MELSLDGKIALVTGASRGIGLAIAAAFASSGASVMLSSRNIDRLETARDGLVANGASVEVFAANAGDPAAATACVAETVSRLGSLDILVNNAGTNPHFGRLIDIDMAQADKIVAVNQRSVVNWSQLAWRAWMRDHGGSILNIASIGGIGVEHGIGYYNSSKAAVVHLTRHLAAELAPQVRVNAIAPGLVRTDFARALWEPDEEAVAANTPLGRIGKPEDIASAAVFLSSGAAGWITGETLVVDGGALVSRSALEPPGAARSHGG